MSSLLIAPSVAPNLPFRPASGAGANATADSNVAKPPSIPAVPAPKVQNAGSAQKRIEAPTTHPMAPAPEQAQGQSQAQATFAAVLKKQMIAPPDPAITPLVTAADDTAISQDNALLPQGIDTSTLIPFIEQLIPQLARKADKIDEKIIADPTNAGTTNNLVLTVSAAPLPISGQLASNADSFTQDQTGQGSDTAPALNLLDRRQTSAIGVQAQAAISADETLTEQGLASGTNGTNGTKGASDFTALISSATEQLSGNSSINHAGQHTNARAAAVSDAPLRMESAVGNANWSNELGNKLTWMASSQRQQADLVLNPPQLGRVEISLTVNGDQASVVFASSNAEVRELLEGSLPRLREIMSGAGINLGEAQVGSESASQFGTQDQKGNNTAARGVPLPAEIGADSILLATQRGTLTGRGMVDIFA